MSRITRQAFVDSLANQQIDVSQLPQSMRSADLDGDGKVSGNRETSRLFDRVDRLDHDGSRNSISSTSAAGRLYASLKQPPMPRERPAAADAPSPSTTTSDAASSGTVVGRARGTGYYPANNQMEGGFTDKKGKPLHTLQAFLAGKAPDVSIALDKKLYQNGTIHYGDTFRIPELEKKYGRPIVFKAVDTGGAFTGKGFSRVDICTGSARDSYDPTVNGPLTLVKT